ncbi:HEAT repeat domain-containing protein [Sulfurirhabdus autotrophica]|uniref:Thioredoxin-like protein n=1 Tax=Sulfurirhabdus autotrophica TaxID=1706046 RepID=A0A4R3Y4L5_9PROT|nr:HEAT repeat domain-containing protein [Sulfurirhabdus autotrophica]TCV86341.1 thioredoxin-like protein [Sulfurirhabdus autotrophica]
METTQQSALPKILLMLAEGCPHCPSVLNHLCLMVKNGEIGQLQIVNIGVEPELAKTLNVKTVPWVRIGEYELEGLLSLGELRRWVDFGGSDLGTKTYFYEMLKSGKRDKVERMIKQNSQYAKLLVDLLLDENASMAVRIGIGAVLEEFQGTGLTECMIPGLGEMLQNPSRLNRADACHFLTLIGSNEVIPYLRKALNDDDAEVRETAQEALEERGKQGN